jgi:NAD(P)-dependent dehydrogenase (short-subunit alcohol dehydrogenase family)
LINAASIAGPRLAVVDYPVDPWRNVIATNVTGAYLVCREVLPWMTRQGSGSIINMTSHVAAPTKSIFGASLVASHGVEGLTQILASELRGSGVRVNTVEVSSHHFEPPDPLDPLHPIQSEPPTDWTRAFLWLASDESALHSGERIRAAEFGQRN